MTNDGNFNSAHLNTVKIPTINTGFTQPVSPLFLQGTTYGDSYNFYNMDLGTGYISNAPATDPLDIAIHYNTKLVATAIPNGIYPTAIGNYYYSYGNTPAGGPQVSGIWKTNISSPYSWNATGISPPSDCISANVYFDGNNIYLIGGVGATSGSYISTVDVASINTPTTFTTTGSLPVARANGALAKIGNNLYLYGGSDGSSRSTIYTASVSNPTIWTDTGATLPDTRDSMAIYVDANFIYLYGGNDTGTALTINNNIYTAPISTPTTFTTSGSTLPVAIGGNYLEGVPEVVVAGNRLYLPGQTALVSDPLTWTATNTSVQLATGVMCNSVAVVGAKVYSFGGLTGTGTASTVIQSASTTAPGLWKNESNVLPSAFYGGQLIMTSKYIYLFGGISTVGNYYRALLSDPTTWTLAGTNGPDVIFGKAFIADDQVWYWGGIGGASQVRDGWRASIVEGEIIGWLKNPGTSTMSFIMPLFISNFAMIKAGDYVYTVGGRTSTGVNNIIQRCQTNRLTKYSGGNSWEGVGFITNPLDDPSVVVINNNVYLIGGDTGAAGSESTYILRANMSDLANGYASFVEEGASFIGGSGISKAGATCINDIVYLFGGRSPGTPTAANAIYRTIGSATHLLAYPKVPESTTSLPTIDIKTGALGSYSSFQRTGMLPWLVSDK